MAQASKNGVLNTVKNIFKSLSNVLVKTFDWLADSGVVISDNKPIRGQNGENLGSLVTMKTPKGNLLRVKLIKSEDSAKEYDLYMVSESGSKKAYEGLKEAEVQEYINKFVKDNFGETLELDKSLNNIVEDKKQDESEDLKASQKIYISMSQNIDDHSVVIHKVYANYNPILAHSDLFEIFDDEDFVSSLPETCEQCFLIEPSSEEFGITELEEIPEFNSFDYICDMIKAQYETIFKLQYLKSDCMGIDVSTFIYMIFDQLKFLQESNLSSGCNVLDILASIDFSSLKTDCSMKDCSAILEDYAQVLEFYYPNFNHSLKSLIDSWILSVRYFNR